jgi:dolichol-phosphate mannosyltransferase
MEAKVSIIIPCFNEEKTISTLVKFVSKAYPKNKEIIIVDDCSTDNSFNIISKLKKKYQLRVFKHKKNMGKGAAIQTASKKLSGQIVIIQDADLEYHPKEYKKLLSIFKKNKSCKAVYGSRVLGRKKKKSKFSNAEKFRIFANFILTFFSNLINNQNITDAHTCYKAIDKDVFLKLNLKEKDFAFCPEVTTKLSNKNIQIYEVPIDYVGRGYNDGKKIGLKDAFRALYVIIKYRLFSK